MAKFRFRLETLLRLRIAERDQRRAELTEVLAAEDRLRDQQAEIGEEIQTTYEMGRADVQQGRIDIDRLTAAQRQVAHFTQLIAEKQQLMEQLQPHIRQRREALVEADHEVRILEKLKEKQTERHQQQLDVVDSKLMDEIAQQRFARNEVTTWP
ncbi:MAG: flagellar export protein FliJ [Pirellulaceae bacterium]